MNEDELDELRRKGGLAAMASLDAVSPDFVDAVVAAHAPFMKAYALLLGNGLEHGAAAAILHGICGAIIDQARVEQEDEQG